MRRPIRVTDWPAAAAAPPGGAGPGGRAVWAAQGGRTMSLDVYLEATRPVEVFWANYTHNCNKMAAAAGIYEAVWRPDEHGLTRAGQLIPLLRDGISKMEDDPATFLALNPENGWGSYETFLPWLKKYLAACEENPDATVRVSR